MPVCKANGYWVNALTTDSDGILIALLFYVPAIPCGKFAALGVASPF
jgi:hypothetical protein